jgi:hypothetical protein
MREVASKQHSVNACHVSKTVFEKGRVAKKSMWLKEAVLFRKTQLFMLDISLNCIICVSEWNN